MAPGTSCYYYYYYYYYHVQLQSNRRRNSAQVSYQWPHDKKNLTRQYTCHIWAEPVVCSRTFAGT